MSDQQSFEVRTRGRGTTQITNEVARIVRAAGVATGIAQVFVQHTSCAVLITENADPAVRRDLETLAARWAPDADPEYRHDTEGDDDMAAHMRAACSPERRSACRWAKASCCSAPGRAFICGSTALPRSYGGWW